MTSNYYGSGGSGGSNTTTNFTWASHTATPPEWTVAPPQFTTKTLKEKVAKKPAPAPAPKKLKFLEPGTAAAGRVYVCAACGSRSRDIIGDAPVGSMEWVACCRLNAVLVDESTVLLEEGRVRFARAVRS